MKAGSSEVGGVRGPNGKLDWSDRRKATSFLNLKGTIIFSLYLSSSIAHSCAQPFTDALGRDNSFARHNQEIISIWDTMMTREIAEVCMKFDAQKRELLDEILLRESVVQGKAALATAHKGLHARKGSAVAFNNTVEILEVGKNGVILSSSTELLDRPRTGSRKMRKQVVNKSLPLSVLPLPHSPGISPVSSPTMSPASSPPVSPITSPRGSPHFSSTTIHSPTLSPISPALSSISSHSTSSSTSSTYSSPYTSPTTRSRNSLDAPSKQKAPIRAWAKAIAGRAHKTRSDGVDACVVERVMEEEIAQALVKFDSEKLALLEEIELREIRGASLRFDAERSALLAEIAHREAQRTPNTSRERRHAMRLQRTLARNAASGFGVRDEKIAKEILESNSMNIDKLSLGAEVSMKNPSKSLRREVVWRKNATLRAASRNATRKNLWIAEVPKAKVQAGH